VVTVPDVPSRWKRAWRRCGDQAVAPVEGAQPRRDIGSTIAAKISRVTVAAAESLGERDDADRQRGPRDDMRGQARRAMARDVDQRDLGRAAADVEQDDAVGVALDQRAAAGDGEPRLGLAVDDLELEARLAFDAVEELGPVRCRAAGLGGDQPRLRILRLR
jgi:hypothetical protein